MYTLNRDSRGKYTKRYCSSSVFRDLYALKEKYELSINIFWNTFCWVIASSKRNDLTIE